jgi:hypothetical protein
MLKLNQWMLTHSPKKLKKFKETYPCQKSGGRCFLGQEKNADVGIHAIRDKSSIRSAMQNFRNLHQAIQNKSVVHLHDNAHLNTALTLRHCWSILTGSYLTTVLAAFISF